MTKLPIVLFTALNRREVINESNYESAEVAAFLNKPLKPSLLFDTLVTILTGQPTQIRRQAAAPQMALEDKAEEGSGLRILLTEDHATNQKLFLAFLGHLGYRADVAGNGLEAIQALERQPYDVILMDVQMPEMDGLEATRQIPETMVRRGTAANHRHDR